MARQPFTRNRRQLLRTLAVGGLATSASGWLSEIAHAARNRQTERRACILLWMAGGPSQLDTFDPKPDHQNGGVFAPIATSVPGIEISEHLPRMARRMQRAAIIRSMKTEEGDHARATVHLRTGYSPHGPIKYPTLGSLIGKELEQGAELPNFVSIAPLPSIFSGSSSAGYLGPQYAPLIVGSGSTPNLSRRNRQPSALEVANLEPPEYVTQETADARLLLLDDLNQPFLTGRHDATLLSHAAAYQRAQRMMRGRVRQAFELDRERQRLRDRYGRSVFGQGCLLARRLVERGVSFVEVSLPGWDTHRNNFRQVRTLSSQLDAAWSTLLDDLRSRGLLESTLVVWVGEFGRTPRITNGGRNHFPHAWSSVLCGGGIRGGQVYGATSASGEEVKDRPVSVPDFVATICRAMRINPKKQRLSNVGRPISIADPAGRVLEELIA